MDKKRVISIEGVGKKKVTQGNRDQQDKKTKRHMKRKDKINKEGEREGDKQKRDLNRKGYIKGKRIKKERDIWKG